MTNNLTVLHRVQEAEEFQKKAEAVNQNDKYVLSNKVNILIKKRQIGEAKEICMSFINKNPNNIFFIKLLARCYCEEANYKQAVQLLEANKNSVPEKQVNFLNVSLVSSYIQLGEYDKASEILQQMRQNDKEGKWAFTIANSSVRLERYKGNFEKAKEILAKEDASNPIIIQQYSWLYLSTGEYDKAREMIVQLPESYKRVKLKFLARLEAVEGNIDKATQILQEQNLQDVDYDFERSILDKIDLTVTTLKRIQREPENKKIKNDLQAMYELAKQQNDTVLVHLIEREYGPIEIKRENAINVNSAENILGELYVTDLYIQDLQQQGRQAKSKEDLDKEVAVCNEIIRVDPNNIEARKRIIEIAIRDGDLQYAEGMCYQILDLDTENLFAYEKLLEIKQQLGDFEEIQDIATQIVDIDYLNLPVRKVLLEKAKQEKDADEVKRLNIEILILDPKDINARYELIQIAMGENNTQLVFKLINDASKYGQTKELEHLLNGTKPAEQLASQPASQQIKAGLPERKEPLARKSKMQTTVKQQLTSSTSQVPVMQTQHTEIAISTLHRPTEVREQRQVTVRSATQEEKEKTFKEIQEAIRSGDEQRIIQAYERRIEIVPKDRMARDKLAKLLIGEGKLQEAKKTLEEGLEIEPDNCYFLNRLATIAAKQKNKSELFRLNSRLIQLEPNNVSALMRLFSLSEDVEEKAMYATGIQRIIHNPENREKLARLGAKKIKDVDIKTKKYCVGEIQLEEEKDTNDSGVISQIRRKMRDEDISSNEAKEMLESIADDTSIRATALKAEIYARVFYNFKKAQKIVEDRAKQEGTTSKEKRLLHDAQAILKRAQKGIPPRELENIR